MSRLGWFAIGAEGISKPMNLGALMRTGNAFGAAFTFSIKAHDKLKFAYKSDTSKSAQHIPYYSWESMEDAQWPVGATFVGVELTDDAVDLPQFAHPKNAVYILGPEQGSLSPEIQAQCDVIVKIPTKFCINLSLAGALVMYDRRVCLETEPRRGRFPG